MTVDRLRERIARSMGWRRPQDWPSQIEPVEIANEAGHWLYALEDWNCLARPDADLSLVVDQSWIDLPADFGAIVSDRVRTSTGFGHSLRLGTQEEVRDARDTNLGSALAYVGCIVHTGPGLTGPRSTARLEIGPVPSASATSVFKLSYKAGWVEVGDGSDHILVPSWMQSVYVEAATAFVAGREAEDAGSLADRLDRLTTSALMIALRSRDGAIQTSFGPMRGGVGSMFGDSCDPIVTHTDVPIVGSNA